MNIEIFANSPLVMRHLCAQHKLRFKRKCYFFGQYIFRTITYWWTWARLLNSTLCQGFVLSSVITKPLRCEDASGFKNVRFKISNFFETFFYYNDDTRWTHFEQNSSLETFKTKCLFKFWFFLASSSVVGGDDFRAIVLEIRRGPLSESSTVWCIPPTDSKRFRRICLTISETLM